MRIILIVLSIASQCVCAQEWTDLKMYDSNGYFICATSELKDTVQARVEVKNRYGALNLIDGNYSTAWVEGAEGSGAGQSVFISLPPNCQSINLHGGYGKSASLYAQNGRVKRLKLSCHIGINPTGYITEVATIFKTQKFAKEHYIDLKDEDNLQTFPFPFSQADLAVFEEKVKELYLQKFDEPIYQVATFLELQIEEVYGGSKYDDTCISELFFNDTYVPDYRNHPTGKVLQVYVDEANEGRVLVDTPAKKAIAIIDDPEAVFQLIDVSSCNRWATVIRMPADLGESRVETEYLVVNTVLRRIMNDEIEKILASRLFNPLFLVNKDDMLILEHPQGEIVLR
jgi:hypothetical protein